MTQVLLFLGVLFSFYSKMKKTVLKDFCTSNMANMSDITYMKLLTNLLYIFLLF